MKKILLASITSLVFIWQGGFNLCALSQGTSEQAAATGRSTSKQSGATNSTGVKKQTRLYGHIDEVNYALGAAGVTLDADKLPALVGNVRLGSPAYYRGIEENDKVLSGKIDNHKLYLLIDRKGKRYSLSVNTSPIDLSKEVATQGKEKIPVLSVVPTPIVDVKQQEEEKEKLLSKFDIVIVIDTSGSMGSPLTSEPASKWMWCEKYIHDFSTKMRPYLQGGITVVTFNKTYDIERHCTPERVRQIFETTTPAGGTDMGSPLQEVFRDFLATGRAKPLLVAVLTDGMPNLGPKVEDVIIDATRDMRYPNEIRMTFLEIGEEFDGRQLLKYLDDFLVYDGAKYDIVDTLTFEQVKQIGLIDALLQAINEQSTVADSGNPLRLELTKLKQEIEQQRAAIRERQHARTTPHVPVQQPPILPTPAAIQPSQHRQFNPVRRQPFNPVQRQHKPNHCQNLFSRLNRSPIKYPGIRSQHQSEQQP